MADDDPPFKPGTALAFGKVRRKAAPKPEDPLPELATWELQEGYRILLELMKVSRCFMEAPDAMEKGMGDYYEVIKKPMWLSEMKRKFYGNEYTQLSEFVTDVRLMLLNCYRYFGPHAYHTKRALCMENRLEQKLALLPEELRNKCTLEATNGPVEEVEEAGAEVQSRLLNSVKTERFQREKERRQRLQEERKADEEGKDSAVLQWEREVLFQGDTRELMASMWELPVIGHFVLLGLEHLNIEEIPLFEIERIFLMPQASRSLSIIMTSLLSPPMMRMKLSTKPPMPYKIWTKKLKQKVSLWYKMYAKSNKNADLVFEKLGIEHQFWKILGDVNPLEEYDFHELTFHQRVWVTKTLCDYLLQHQRILRDLISGQPEEFGNCLGMDRLGAKFLYFRQFFGQDVRVYRQAPDPPSWIERDLEYQAELEAASITDGSPQTKNSKGKKRGRPSNSGKASGQNSASKRKKVVQRGWKHGKLKQPNKSSSSRKQIDGNSDKKLEQDKNSSTSKKIDSDSPPVLTNSETGEVEQPNLDRPPPVLQKETSSPKTSSLKSPVNGDKDCNVQSELEKSDINNKVEDKVDSDKCVNGIDTKQNNIDIDHLMAEWTETPSGSEKNTEIDPLAHMDSETNKHSDPQEPIVSGKNIQSDEPVGTETNIKIDQQEPISSETKSESQEPVSTEISAVSDPQKPVSSETNISDQQTKVADTKEIEIKANRKPLYDPHWLRPSPDDFLLVADSVDGIRSLLTKYCDDDVELIQRINNAKTGRGGRPSCEIKLAKRLNELIIELEPCELKSVTDTKKCRRKLYDEWNAFQIRPEDYVDADETFWLNEKEPVEMPEETPLDEATNDLPLEQEGVPTSQGSEPVEETTNGIPEVAPEEVADTSLDSVEPTVNHRTLRNRRVNVSNFIDLWGDREEESAESEFDSDDSDLWRMSKKKKKKKKSRISKVCAIEDEETGDSMKPKKQQKKKDKTSTDDKIDNSDIIIVPGSEFEGAFSAWLGDGRKEKDKRESKKSNESHGDSSLATSKHPVNAANVRKNLFNETTNSISVSTGTSTTVSTTVSNTGSSTKVSSNTSIVLQHMAQNFAGPSTSTASTATRTSAPNTNASNISAPNISAPNTSAPKTSAPKTSAPKTSAPKATGVVEEVVLLSDDSDDEIQFVGMHKPPPVVNKPPRTKLILHQRPSSTVLQSNVTQIAVLPRTGHPAGTRLTIISQSSSLPRIETVTSIASPMTTPRQTQQVRYSTSTLVSPQQHSVQSPTAAKSNTNSLLSTPPSKAAQPIVVGTVGNSSILLTSPRQSTPATPQRKQRILTATQSPLAVVEPTPTLNSPSQLVVHTPTQVMMSPQTVSMRSPQTMTVRSPQTVSMRSPQIMTVRSPQTVAMRSPQTVTVRSPQTATMRSPQTVTMRPPSQVTVRSPTSALLPVGTEITLCPSSVHTQVQVSSAVQTTRFTSPNPRMPASPAVTPAGVGNLAQAASGTTATLVVVPGDGNTSSNYALAFPNGTRMILTPEQVAQIRAENNGVLGTGNLSGIFSQ